MWGVWACHRIAYAVYRGEMSQGSTLTAPASERSSNLECYRILVMLLIVAHHYVVNSGLWEVMMQQPLSHDSLFLFLFGAWGKMGINCFVLITGYFMCRSAITLRKFLKLVLQVLFYSVGIYVLFVACGYEPFQWKELVKSLMPVKSVSVNFTGCFIVFFLCIPFLNILVRNMDKRLHLCLLALSLGVYTILATLRPVSMNYVTWFCILYFVSSYIRLYGLFPSFGWKTWGVISLGFLLLSSASVIGFLICGISPYRLISDSNASLALLTAVALFMFFKSVPIPQSRLVNAVAACTFGVLLIHAHSDTMRRWLWRDVLDNAGQYGCDMMVLHAIGSVLGVFCLCALMDWLRIRFLEKPVFGVIDRMLARRS